MHSTDQPFLGRQVTVMGLGHFGGGVGAARWLAGQGARVTVTDAAEEAALADSLPGLDGVPIYRRRFGGHDEADFISADLLVVNPSVRPGNPFVAAAARANVRIATEIELFLERCPAQMIGVTGSNGKSTTAAMTAAICRTAGYRTWLGGNFGGSLLSQLGAINPEDRVVLELSSFQLWYLRSDLRMPSVAIITNCTPNHLNWHPDFAHYCAAKQRLLLGQHGRAAAIIDTRDTPTASWAHLVRGRHFEPLPDNVVPLLRVPGEHNRRNAALAGAAAMAAGCPAETVVRGLEEFSGLPQRLEPVTHIGGRAMVNDSAATTPESVIAALAALPAPRWLLAGGSDKGADLRPLIAAIIGQASGAAFFGRVAPSLGDAVLAQAPDFRCVVVANLAEALDWCCRLAPAGSSIVLSPGFASHDQFTNFRQRGEVFATLVRNRVGLL